MATNPLQEMIPQVLQQLMQNPQMLQQIVQQVGPLLQMAGGGAGSTMPGGTGYIPPSGRMNQMLGGEVPLQSREQGAAKSLRWEKEEIPRAMQRTPTNNRRPMTPGLQRSIDDDPRGAEDYRNRMLPEEMLQPGETEPISQYTPGLLMKLAMATQGDMAMPRMMEQGNIQPPFNPIEMERAIPEMMIKANTPFVNDRTFQIPMEQFNPQMLREIQDQSRPPTEWITEAPDENEQIY